MTQLTAFARAILPVPPSQGQRDFHLIVLNEIGSEVITQFSAYKYAGLDFEVAAAVAPGGAGKTLTFSGRPELVTCGGNEVVIFRFNDGDGWRDVFYGAVTEGWAAKPSRAPRDYSADAEYLLNARTTDGTAYPAQDPAFIAQDLVRRLRHPALNFNEIDFPPTGTTLEGGFEQAGIPLGDALAKLAESVEDAGRSIAYGIDGRGNVFFKQLTGTLNVTYREEDYTDLPVKADDTVTAVRWVIGSEPSVPGYSGSYSPGTMEHVSVPDPALHARYGREIGLTPAGQTSLWLADRALGGGYSTSGFLNSDYAVDGNLGTKSVRNPALTTSNGYYQLNTSFAKNIYGVRLTYIMDYDVVPAADIRIQLEYLRVTLPEQYLYPAVIYKLPYTGPDYPNTIDFILPPTKPIYIDFSNVSGVYAQGKDTIVSGATVYVNHIGTFSISEITFIKFNPTALDAAARAEIRTPASQPAQLVLRRDYERGRVGYYAPPRPTVKLSNGQTSQAAEYRYAYDVQNGVSTVIDLGNPTRDGDAALAQNIRLAIDNATRQSEVRNAGGNL